MTSKRRYRAVAAFQRRVANPVARRLGPYVPGLAAIETIGRTSGQRRVTPVGGRLEGSTFWMVSEFGHQSQYVRNLLAEPRVRVRVGGTWRPGTATVLPDDDAVARLRTLPRVNGLAVRTLGDQLLTVRVDLDPPSEATGGSK